MTPLVTEQQDALRETLWRPADVDIDGASTLDDEERIILAVRRPMRVDASVVDSLARILAAQRRTEDAIGSAGLIRPVTAQLATIEDLVVGARGPARSRVIDMAAQWAEFAGWLHTNTGQSREARMWFDRASEWAIEAENTTLAATAFSFKGYLAFLLGQIGPMVGLTQAAQRDASVWVGQRGYDAYQEARGLALLADLEAAVRKVDEGRELAALAHEQSDERPPWIYYYTPSFYALERGLTYRYLGRDNASHNDEAIRSLTAALAGVGESRASEWVGEYVYHLAVAYVQAGAPDKACETAMEVMGIACATESVRLFERLRVIHARLAQRWPDDPPVIELGEALHR
jgi:tetratricopeptide (TPR) repeat protein